MRGKSELGFVPKGFDLEEGLLEQLSARPGHQRCVVGDEELLLVVHEVPQPGVPEREPLVFWRTPNESWYGPDGSKGLGLLSALLDRYQEKIDGHEAVIDEQGSSAAVFGVARHAGPMTRSSRNLLLALDQALAHDEENRVLRGVRDRARELERAAELLHHDAKLLLEFQQAEHAEEQKQATNRLNATALKLNLMAGFFLPLVGLGGLLGMNVDIPAFVKPWFWGVFVSGVVMGFLVLLLVGWSNRDPK